MQKQRQLISEAKLRIRGIGKEIADLKKERYCLELLILRDEYINSKRKKNLTKKTLKKLKHGQRNKKDMLKAIMENGYTCQHT